MEENEQTTGKASKIIIGIIIAIAVAVGAFFLIKNLVCHRTYAKIIATNFVAYDLTRAVVGDSAEVTLLIEPGKDYHTYEPSADDKNAIKEADLFVFIGGESESWVYDIIGEDFNPNEQYLKLANFVGLRTKLKDRADTDSKYAYYSYGTSQDYDEHMWFSIMNAITFTHVIADRLSMRDQEKSEFYQENSVNYTRRLNDIDQMFRRLTMNTKDKVLAVADRFPYQYMFEDYGLNYITVTDDCGKKIESSDEVVAEFVEKVKNSGARALLKTEYSNDDFAKKIANNLGMNLLTLNSMHSVSQAEFDSGITYADIMEKNYEVLTEAFGIENSNNNSRE